MRHHLTASLVVVAIAAACSGSTTSSTSGEGTESENVELHGSVEKGPFVLGSTVLVGAIDTAGRPTGDVFTTQTRTDTGEFEVTLPAPSAVFLEGTGYYYNEVTGALSLSPLTLRGFHVIAGPGQQSATLNLATHLTNNRIRYLLGQGSAFDTARAQAERELVVALRIGPAGYALAGAGSSLSLLTGDTDDNAWLLAASSVLAQAAVSRAGPGGPIDGALQELLNSLSLDLEDDGQIAEALERELLDAQRTVDGDAVMTLLAARFAAVGASAVVPNIHRILDSDLDGIPNIRDGLAVDAAHVRIERQPIGTPDTVIGEAGFASGGCTPAEAVLFAAVEGGAELARVPTAADGSFGPVEVGTATSAPARLFVQALDDCGSASARTEITRGRDTAGPTVDVSQLTIVRHDLQQPDAVAAMAGAVDDAVSAVLSVRIWDAADGGNVVVETQLLADGSFRTTAVGTSDSSFAHLWLEPIDKAGNIGQRVAFAHGSDEDAPSIDGGALLYVRRPTGDELQIARGAISDQTSALRTLRILEPSCQDTLAELAFGVDGSAPPAVHLPATSALPRVCLVAIDKAGVASVPTLSRGVDAELQFAPETAGAGTFVAATAYRDLRSVTPGYAVQLAGRAADPLAAALAEADANRTAITGVENHVPVSPGWEGDFSYVARRGIGLSFDSSRGKVVLFGGRTYNYATGATLEWDGTVLRKIETASHPEPRNGAAMAYDELRNVTVLFGGGSALGQPLADTWEFDGNDWHPVATPVHPPASWTMAMVWDSLRGRLVLFVGGDIGGTPAETWEYDGSWARVETAHTPSARMGTAMAFDPISGSTLLYGGGTFPDVVGDLWAYDGADWHQLTWNGLGPGPQMEHSLTYVPGEGVVLLGADSSAWSWDGASWRNFPAIIDDDGYWVRNVVWDAARNRLVAFSGAPRFDDEPIVLSEWDGAAWNDLQPSPRKASSPVYDPIRGVTYVHALAADGGGRTVWSYGSEGWAELPHARTSWALGLMAFEPLSDRLLARIVGAEGERLCALTPGGWDCSLPFSVLPPGYEWGALASDTSRGGVVLAGWPTDLPDRVQLFASSERGWEPLQSTNMNWDPDLALAVDPRTGVVLLASALDGLKLWRLEGTDLTPMTLTQPRVQGPIDLLFDLERGTFTLLGRDTAGATRAAWSLTDAGWVRLDDSGYHRVGQGAVYDAREDRLLDVWGGGLWFHSERAARGGFAGHLFTWEVGTNVDPAGMDVSWTGSARVVTDGATATGAELLVWNWDDGAWTPLGSHAATSDDLASDRTIAAHVAGPLQAFVRGGRVWLLAAPAAGGGDAATIESDQVAVSLRYAFPAPPAP